MLNRLKNNRGVTLVEVLIALVVLLIVFMGLIQASILTIESNLRNEIRDEAVRIAAENMTKTKAEPFLNVLSTGGALIFINYAPTPVARTFRNLSIQYTIQRSVVDLDADNKQIGIRIRWANPSEPAVIREHIIYSQTRSK